MLYSLSIRNFAIITRLDLEFGTGFNVLTGETGAGKSIIMDALNLILGGRAGAEMVRGGADKAAIDAVFDVARSPELQSFVTEMGFDLEDDKLFVTREVTSAGKSACKVQGRPCTVAQLKELGDWLVDLHGQHEHQSLLAVSRHLDMLDDWGGKAIHDKRAEVGKAYASLQRLKAERDQLEKDARERSHLLDLYQFQVKEIADAQLTVGEDDELATEYKRVANAQKLAESAGSAASALSGEEIGGGALEALTTAISLLEEAAELDGTLQPALDSLKSAFYELEETERDLVRYQDSVELNPERITQIDDRLELLRTLKRKYGDTVEEIITYGSETASKLDTLEHSEERGAQLKSEIDKASQKLTKLAEELTKLRKKAAKEFESITLGDLRDLAMEKARFEVHIEPMTPNAKGADKVEFLIATNPGEPLRPLAKVASGGEISRVMLAVKSAMARQEALPTMVFDEVDVGVGGRIASVIADKIETLSKSAQILCITHLAQIAARGDTHFSIEKHEENGRTVATVTPLSEEERVGEIARMIGGTGVTETVLQHAREMLAKTA